MADPGVQASIHKNLKTTLPRVYNFIASSRFREVNLVDRLYPDSRPVALSHWGVPGGEGSWQDWTFDEIVKQEFTPVSLGDSFGPTWSTHWFKLQFQVPDEWAGQEVRLRWGSNSEATVWSDDGRVLQGLSTGDSVQRRTDYALTRSHQAGAPPTTLYVEMAANRLFGAGPGDNINPTDNNMYFTLSRAEIATLDTAVYKLTRDLEVLHQLAEVLTPDPRGYQALYTANQMVNSIIAGQESAASDLADQYFTKGNGERQHTLATIGNCHIDSAWLWPYSETKRKVARSFSAQLKLMEDYPEHIFVASQAQQWAWCKQYYPELFARVKEQVAQGRFLPVGGTWVEMDGNIPSGESFVRQFLYGQKFYQEEFGYTCKEFWLPDTFGYSCQIPGMMKHMGLTRFLTQKMSWSMVNKFPHHNFTWEGIDGSAVLAHFPPGDSYNMFVNVDEAVRTVNNLEDKGRVSTSAFLFGYGDGGGGPTQDMLERRRRLQDTDGVPRLTMATPDDLFTQLEKEQHNMCRWVGELYLELHNGTYTTQAAMKRLCRQAEFRLRDAEFLLSVALGLAGSPGRKLLSKSQAELETAWKKVCLNQFHDVVPGSGIGIIYPQAEQYYMEAIAAADATWDEAVATIFGTSPESQRMAVNSLQWARQEVVKEEGSEHVLVQVPPMGAAPLTPVMPSQPATVSEDGGKFTLDNGLVKAVLNSRGQVESLVVAGDERDVFVRADGAQLFGNQLVMYDDEPVYWDAWDVMDYHLETPRVLNAEDSGLELTPLAIVETGPLVVKLRWSLKISPASTLSQDIELHAGCPYVSFNTFVSWHEDHKILKALFDTGVHGNKAVFDVQFGQLERPTHVNTSWDSARYEVCGHKWAGLSEHGWGVAVLNDSKYGWMARGHTLALSLLRAPKAPDYDADMKDHSFKYALMPHTGTVQEAQVARRAYEFNNPLRIIEAPAAASDVSWVSVGGEGVVVHTVKPCEDASGDVLVRVFESHGAQSRVTLQVSLAVSGVVWSNGMEIKGEAVDFTTDAGTTSIPLALTPFAIAALRISFASTE